jgi:membrane associated rhomboid family serine protease
MRFMFAAIDGGGLRSLREEPGRVPLTPLASALTDSRVLLVTGVFVVANFLAILGLGGVSAGGIAWEAHLGGYFAGLLTFGFFDRSPRFHSSRGSMLN